MTTEAKVYKQKYTHRPEPMIHNTEHLTPEGAFMMALVERWGMVMATDDGEDSAGRKKSRIMTEDELITRTANIADLAYKVARENEWTITVPSISEMDAVKPDNA